MFWESTIPTYVLSKILQVSCHRCNKAINNASKCVWSFSVREIKNCTNLWWQSNKSDGLHNKGCYHKAQYDVTFFCIKRLCIQTKKCIKTSTSLCEGPIFYFYVYSCYAWVKVITSIPFYFLFGKHHVVGKDLGTYIQLDMSEHELLLLTSPFRWVCWEAKL